MKSILVTGGLGFVGSHLIDHLLGEGCRVTVVDNLQSNVMDPGAFSERCDVIIASIEDIAESLCSAPHKFDEIYHLASVVGPSAVLRYAGVIARSVIATGEAVTEIALHHGARLLTASTSEVYGRPGVLRESDDCIVAAQSTVRLEYAVAKLTCEVASINRALVTPLHVNVVRPFNIAGPRQLPDGGFVLPRFVAAAICGRPLTVFGDGTQIRAFTDVRDIVSGLIAVMRGEAKSQVLNLGNPANEISILDLANRVLQHAKSTSVVEHVDPKDLFGDLYEEGIERVPNVELSLARLPWRPTYSLDRTIEDTLAWYRERPDIVQSFLATVEKFESAVPV